MRQPPEFDSTSPAVASEVREFYDRYPYPRPVDSLDNYRRLWQAGQRRRANYHLFWPSRSYREDYSILIAGCGKAYHALASRSCYRQHAGEATSFDVTGNAMPDSEPVGSINRARWSGELASRQARMRPDASRER